jgi:hypothetical protein
MLSTVAYIDTGEDAFYSWLETFTASIFPRSVTGPSGDPWVVQPAGTMGGGYGPPSTIEASYLDGSELPDVCESRAPDSPFVVSDDAELPQINFHVDYLAQDRVAVWITCWAGFLDAICWEMLGHIRECWPNATLEVLSPRDAVPPPTVDPRLAVLNHTLMNKLEDKWGGKRILRRRIRVAAMRRRGNSIGDIANSLKVSNRTVNRDIAELKEVRLIL